MTTDRPEAKTVKIPVERMADLIKAKTHTCRACAGDGTVVDLDASELSDERRITCGVCDGTGYTH